MASLIHHSQLTELSLKGVDDGLMLDEEECLDDPDWELTHDHARVEYLTTAAREGRVEAVRRYLKSNYYTRTHRSNVKPIDRLDQDEVGALHYAARYNHQEVMQLLIDNGASVNNLGQDDLTPLHYASRYAPKGTSCDTDEIMYVPLPPTLDECDEGEDDIANKPMTEIIAEDYGSPPIKFLIESGANVNANEKYNLTALHCAADRGNYAAVVELLKCPAAIIELKDKLGETALHLAVRAQSVPCVRKLLKAGANPNTANENNLTALHSACTEGSLEIVQMLTKKLEEKGLTNFINQGNDEWMTPLHFGVEVGEVDIVNFLVDKGADVTIKRKNLDTALHMAASHGFVDIAKKLVESKSDLEAKNLERMTPLHSAARMDREEMMHLLIESGADIEATDKDGCTPLIVAAGWGQSAAVLILLEAGADVFARDKRDKSAIFHSVEEARPKILQKLLERRGKMNLTSEIDRFQNTPLHLASQLGYISCVKVLLEFGFSSDAQNEDDMCPLHLAALHGRIQTVKELVKWDPAIVNDEDEIANTPLHYAAQAGHVKTVIFLTEESADVDAKNQFGWTPMDCAAACGMTKTLAALLDAGGEVDPIDRAKTTPLHLASKNGHVDTVLFLLEHDADIRLTDADGYNSLELATKHCKKEVAEAIISHRRWHLAMENRHPNGDTPMKLLIRIMPDVAMMVFNKCTDDGGNDEHVTSDSKDYMVEFDYRYLDELYQEEDDKSADSKSLISEGTAAETEDNAKKTPMSQTLTAHPLQVMIKAKRIELLDHPIVQSLLHNKWEYYGRWFYYVNLVIYLVYLAFLTVYAISQYTPVEYKKINGSEEDIRCEPYIQNKTIADSDCAHNETMCCYPRKKFMVFPSGLVVLVLCAIRLLIEFAQFIFQRSKYFSLNNTIELALFGSSIYFTINIFYPTHVIHIHQWQIGVFSVFVGWMNMIIFLRKFPKFGIYIVMFVTILMTFLQIMIILLIFIVAFALSFNMVMDQNKAFQNVYWSLMKTFVMMTGELEYDGYYVDKSLDYPVAAFPLFVCFIIVVPIVFMNLLVGLAVDDIKEVQFRAGLERSVMKIELIFQIENLLPIKYLRKVNKRKKRFYVNRRRPVLGGLLFGLSIKDVAFDGERIQEALHPQKTGIDELKQENEQLEKNIRRMRSQIDQVSQQNRQILNLVKSLVTKGSDDTESDDLTVDQDCGTELGNAPNHPKHRKRRL